MTKQPTTTTQYINQFKSIDRAQRKLIPQSNLLVHITTIISKAVAPKLIYSAHNYNFMKEILH